MSVKIIAEVGSVHDGSFGNAKKLAEMAAKCGTDAIKFQIHISEAETLKNAPMPQWFKGEPRFEYFKRTGYTIQQWKEIADVCKANNIEFMASAFSHAAIDLLEDVGVKSHKVPSGEVTNIPMLEYMASMNKPIYLSSGMSSWAELDKAVEACSKGKGEVILMQCTTQYPLQPENVGLNVMLEMKERYGKSIAYSDHTEGLAACISAVALGAIAVEKHITFSRYMYGSDAPYAMEPQVFTQFCKEIKDAAIMRDTKVVKDKMIDKLSLPVTKVTFEKSIVAKKPLKAGHILATDDIDFKKPGDGISAARYQEVIGAKLKVDVEYDHKFQKSDFET